MADLHQVIDARAGTDDGVAGRPPVDCGVGTNLHVVFHDHTTKLWDTEEPRLRRGEAEALLTDSGSRIDVDPRAKQSVTEAGMGANAAVAAHGDTARTDLSSGFNDRVWTDLRG